VLEKLLPDVFRITIPLPGHPLKTVNSYIITSKERNLLVDTAWNRFDCAEVLLDGLAELGINLSRTDVFLTHIHADHAGLIDLFTKHHAKIFCGQADIEYIDHFLNTSTDKTWPILKALAAPHGFSLEEIAAGIEAHSGNRYNPSHPGNFFPIKDRDEIIIGNYTLSCKATPGHTLGHTCLYDPIRKLLFSGDHLLGQLSPTLSQWSLDGKGLAHYLSSLKAFADYAVDLVLPGHWEEFLHFHVRLKETLAYHQQRNAEILTLLGDGTARNAYQISAALSWNQKHGEWIFFPITRKWSAVADTIAHLCYLRDQGLLVMRMNQQEISWELTSS
jgi:glyoxylase-like metal-dependent hydrolase (beta-lactamase superfamily II)